MATEDNSSNAFDIAIVGLRGGFVRFGLARARLRGLGPCGRLWRTLSLLPFGRCRFGGVLGTGPLRRVKLR